MHVRHSLAQKRARRSRIPVRQVGRPSPNHERGQTLVEFAIILLVLLLIVFGILDFGRAVYAYHVVANAAREGARAGRVWPMPSDATIVAKALDKAAGLNPTHIAVTVSHPLGNIVRVGVSYTFTLVTPLISDIVGDELVLRSTSTMYTGY